ncbi:MAG TPA: phosphoribosylamine--glycine ligase, partial [Bacillota bacterium]|nr:phosphoribosylamine--glycine ligase [Bacillota bacterium]
MRVLIIGGGGREHALAWKMAQSSRLDRLYCLPGNAGIAALADCPEVDRMEEGEVLRWSLDRKIRLVVFGPEAQLVAGWADGFRKAGLLAFGPGAEGAALEGSKVWAKQFMAAHKIPTAPFVVAGSYDEARRLLEQRDEGPVVVKADGLAAGKGVIVARNLAEAEEALDKIMKERAFGSAGERVVIEECLSGEEASVLAITDGSRLLVLPAAQDHKAIGEGDRGPNTGGMGSYSPAPVVDAELASQVEERVFRPLLKGLAQRGIDYRGVIYAGLMIRDREINVLEFNVRFGD